MSEILVTLARIYGITLLGYIAVKAQWFDKRSTEGLLKFVYHFSLPPLLFQSLSQAKLPDSLPLDLLGSYYLGAFSVLIAGWLLSRFIFSHLPSERIVVGFSGSFSNTVLLGIPIILYVCGEEGGVPLFMLISVHGLIMFSMLSLSLEFSSNQSQTYKTNLWWSLKSVGKNPIIWGIATGILFNQFGLNVPKPLDQAFSMLSQTAIPCSLFSLGALLAGYKIAGNLRLSMTAVALKNLLHPLVVWFLAEQFFSMPPLWVKVAVLLAAMPTGVSVLLFAHRYEQAVEIASTSIFLSTVFSMVSITGILLILGN